MRIAVNIAGCDDNTRFVMDATGEELAFLRKVGALSEETSECRCQPRLFAEAIPEARGEEET